MQLPTRVWRDFEREQYRSELLVTAVHLLIAALLAVLYASSPPGFSPDTPIRAVPPGLTLLSVLKLVRLYFAVAAHSLDGGPIRRRRDGRTDVRHLGVSPAI